MSVPAARALRPEPLTREAFAPFGTVVETAGATAIPINQGTTMRYHALAEADPGPDGRAILSIFVAMPRPTPVAITMLERHPLGGQAFMPLAARIASKTCWRKGLPELDRGGVSGPQPSGMSARSIGSADCNSIFFIRRPK